MALRPTPARWFELLTAREQLTGVLECLGTTGMVELETHSDASASHTLPALRAALEEYRALEQKYASYWPEPRRHALTANEETEHTTRQALERIRAWARDAEPVVVEIQSLANDRSNLALVQEVHDESVVCRPQLERFSTAGPALAARLYALPVDTRPETCPPSVLLLPLKSGRRSYFAAAGPADQIAALDEIMSGLEARQVPIPPDLPAGREAALAHLRTRLEDVDARSASLQTRLAALAEEHDLAAARGVFRLVEWFVSEVPELPVTEHFAWVTGWTSDLDGSRLSEALDARGLDHLLRFVDAPTNIEGPVILRNPVWAQPFELFAGLLGMPGRGEADPSALVAVMAPLMFGFMFGDVGQGAVLVVIGLALRRRFPALALLVPGGVAAIAFGVAFGSVFASEAIIPALWLHPLSEPVTLLGVTLAFGAFVVILGLVLDACQYHWCGLASRWWLARSGLLVTFVALLATIVFTPALWVALAGLVWFVAGESLAAPRRRLAQLGVAVGEAAERLLQMVVNTVSFVRVGAFALAHSGLAAAVVGVAAAADQAVVRWLVMLLGNALIIALEGLVVGIQTTRLVLFEFFIRFLKGQGRRFKPLPAPGAVARHERRPT